MNFLNLGFSDAERQQFDKDKINSKKKIGQMLSRARKQAKSDKCFYCGKQVAGFCNSHFVPAFCLRNIAFNGELFYSNIFVNIPFLDIDKGVNEAGTFHIICRECDSSIFRDYENPDNYTDIPTPKMLAQIAMKNYLKFISKRFIENEMNKITSEVSKSVEKFLGGSNEVKKLDLLEYQKSYEKAKRLSKKDSNDDYYLFYCETLNYVVPMAFQCGIVLISDLYGAVINDIYCMSPDYHPKELHICVFPMQDKTIVMMFIDSEDKRYRKFYQDFNKQPRDAKLGIINYIIFLYSEDVFLSKNLPNEVLTDEKLISLSQRTSIGLTSDPTTNPINEATKLFDLNKWNEIPNLLDEKYKIR